MAEETKLEPRWYVVHTYSGYEKKVLNDLDKKRKNPVLKLEDKILDIQVPTEFKMVQDKRTGELKQVEETLFYGYVFVKLRPVELPVKDKDGNPVMEGGEPKTKVSIDPDLWYIIRNTQGVTGFLGAERGTEPIPLPASEVARFALETEELLTADIELDFKEGDDVNINSGSFDGYWGTVTEIDRENGRVKIKTKPTGIIIDVEFGVVEKL